MNSKDVKLIAILTFIVIAVIIGIGTLIHYENKIRKEKILNLLKLYQMGKEEGMKKSNTIECEKVNFDCQDGYKIMTIGENIYHYGFKNSWDDIEPIKCEESKSE